jgi:D-alanine transaminase
VTSATTVVMPVVEVDGRKIGDGRPGALTAELRKRYVERLRNS